MFGFLATAAAKLASLSLATQAAAGITVAVAGVGGVAVAGDLPAPVQDTVASVVSSVTPFSLPHSSTTTPSTTTATGTSDTSTSSSPATDSPATATPSLPSQAAFGQSVAAAAKSGGVNGQTISSQARTLHQPAQAAAHRPTQATAPSSSATAATTSDAPVHGKPATVGSGRP